MDSPAVETEEWTLVDAEYSISISENDHFLLVDLAMHRITVSRAF